MIYTTFIQEDLTDELIKVCQQFKDNEKGVSGLCTVNGFQSENILHYSGSKHFKKIFENILPKPFNIFHIHVLSYEKEGYQETHNHERTEDYSFILYLNTLDSGHTVFKDYGKVKPEKNKLILFKSSLWHYGEKCDEEKLVAVGACKFLSEAKEE